MGSIRGGVIFEVLYFITPVPQKLLLRVKLGTKNLQNSCVGGGFPGEVKSGLGYVWKTFITEHVYNISFETPPQNLRSLPVSVIHHADSTL